MKPLYKAIANALAALDNCVESGNREWAERWQTRLMHFDTMLPSGAGFDSGSVIVKDGHGSSKGFVIETAFHHMDEHGGYDGWTDHRVTVRPDLLHDFVITVGGRNRNDIKDYIAEVFDSALRRDAVNECPV